MNILQFVKDGKICVIVKPNSKTNEIISWDNERNALRINIKAEPENNKANIELIKFMSKLLKKEVNIVTGLTSKKKILRIS